MFEDDGCLVRRYQEFGEGSEFKESEIEKSEVEKLESKDSEVELTLNLKLEEQEQEQEDSKEMVQKLKMVRKKICEWFKKIWENMKIVFQDLIAKSENIFSKNENSFSSSARRYFQKMKIVFLNNKWFCFFITLGIFIIGGLFYFSGKNKVRNEEQSKRNEIREIRKIRNINGFEVEIVERVEINRARIDGFEGEQQFSCKCF